MPKDTFFNLPAEKRTLICDVAIDEFAAYSYDSASVNRIVAGAGIAKGSFYQYFEDKKDLYGYIWQLAAEEKAAYISPAMANPAQHDLFTLLRELYISGIKFAAERPRYAEIGEKLLKDKESPIFDDVMASQSPVAHSFFEKLLADAVKKGEVRANLDIKMFAHLITSMHTFVVEYFLQHTDGYVSGDMLETVDKYLEFLRVGLGAKRSEAEKIEPFNSPAGAG